MEGTPQTIDAEDVLDTLGSIDGVTKVHDLHIWTITSGLDMLTCHIVVREDVDEQVVLQEAIDRIRETYKIEHTTIQVEKPDLRHTEFLI